MDPLSLLSGIGSAFTGGIFGLIGNRQQSKNIDKQIQAQKEENEKNREYNLMLARMQNQWSQEEWEKTANWNEAMAEKSNQWSIDQWNRNNQYNSPTAIRDRLEDADLNRDLIYGGGAGSLQSVSSPSVTSPSGMSPASMTAGAPSTPVDMSALGQKPTIGQAYQMALQSKIAEYQFKKTDAEIQKLDADTKSVIKDTEWKDALNTNTLTMANSTIKLNDSVRSLNKVQQRKLRKEIEHVDAQIGQIREQIELVKAQMENVDADTALKQIEAVFKAPMMRAQIKQLSAVTNLSYTQAQVAVEGILLQQLGYELDKRKVDSQILTDMMQRTNMSTEGAQMELELQSDTEFLNLERSSKLLQTISQIAHLLQGGSRSKKKK